MTCCFCVSLCLLNVHGAGHVENFFRFEPRVCEINTVFLIRVLNDTTPRSKENRDQTAT